MRMMLICVGILFGCIFIYKVFITLLIKHSIANASHVTPVSVMQIDYSTWQPQLTASGSLRAIKGVNVTTELAGMVTKIYFRPGSMVKEGNILVQLNADAEIGQLQSLTAQSALAKITYDRDAKQYAVRAISKQTLDADLQNWKSLQGQVEQQIATVNKKTIRAPFSGHLGVSNVNPGQYLNTGDTIVSLQALNPIWADFYVPQQSLNQLKVGKMVNVTTDSFPGKIYKGNITTINPAIDTTTRNVEVEATVFNLTNELAPGMFATMRIDTGKPERTLTLPQTAITYNPYGNIVYLVKPDGKDKKEKPLFKVIQAFVQTGETRGDQIQILKGLKKGDTVVTSGMLKLKNNSQVTINNAIQLPNNPAPKLNNEH